MLTARSRRSPRALDTVDPTRLRALIALLAATTLWATSFIAARCVRLHRRALAGLVASVVGVAMVFLVAADSVGGSLLGDLLLLASAASAAVYVVLGRRAFARHRLLAILAGSAGWGLLMLAPFALAGVMTTGMRFPSLANGLVLLYLGVGCSGLAYLLWGFSLRYLAASEAAIIGNLEVVIGVGGGA